MQKRSISNVLIILLIIAILSIVGYIGYSRYIKTLSGEGTGAVAKWSFKVNGQDSTISTINLSDTITNTVANVQSGKLAPGTQGNISYEIDGSGSEVGINYYITIDVTEKPTNLKFYENSDYTNEIIVNPDNTIKTYGEIALENVGTKITKKIYWKWAYETGATVNEISANDDIDTKESGKAVNLGVTIIGEQKATTAEATGLDLAKVVNVGDYVNYSATNNGTYSYTTNSSLTGSTTATTFNSSDTMKWRVLSVNKTTGAVELMSADPTATKVTLSGKAGYKNAETVLNGIGAVYGHGKGATSGRSITIEDLEQYSSYDKTTYTNGYSSTGKYGGTRTYTSGTFINADGSEVTASSSKPVTETQTGYWYTASSYYSNTTAYKMLFRNAADSANKSTYWLASRCVGLGDSYCGFFVRYVGDGGVRSNGLYGSTGSTVSDTYAGVPVVSLTSNIQTSGKDANGAWNLVVQ